MGFSVSGATVILFLGMVISFGIAYSGAFNGFERVNDAVGEDSERVLDQQNTRLAITNVSWETGTTNYLDVSVENTGSTTLSVNDTDLLVDNVYQETFENRTVDGDGDTDLWLPGETLTFTVTNESQPERVKVVSGPGISVTEVV